MRLSLVVALAAPLLCAAPDAAAQAWVGKKAAAPAPQSKAKSRETAQQRCTREAAARGLDGVARRAFMKGCTKG